MFLTLRQLASLGKKTDERLTLYYNDFRKMCERVIKKRSPKLGLCEVDWSHDLIAFINY